jgi:hypothetical protein
MLRALALARYAFAGKSDLFFGFAVDVDVQGTRYVTKIVEPDQGAKTREVLHPWWVRPMAMIGITADVLAY